MRNDVIGLGIQNILSQLLGIFVVLLANAADPEFFRLDHLAMHVNETAASATSHL